jgi:hypothetical protein
MPAAARQPERRYATNARRVVQIRTLALASIGLYFCVYDDATRSVINEAFTNDFEVRSSFLAN